MSRYLTRVSHVLPVVGALAICVMGGITIVDIVLRAVFNLPIQGSYEIVQLSLVTAIYAGIGETFRRGTNLVVDLIDFVAPRVSKKLLIPLADMLSFAVVAVVLAGAIRQGFVVAGYGDTTMDLKIPVYWYWIPVIVGSAWALVCIALRLCGEDR